MIEIIPKPTLADQKLAADIRREISNGVQSGHAFTAEEAAVLVAAHVHRARTAVMDTPVGGRRAA